MALIDAAPEFQPHAAKADRVLPNPIQDYLGGDVDAVKWRAVGGGVRQAVLKTKDKTKVRLLSIPGGTAMPDHSHRGLELTLVLQGAFLDEDSRFGPGDVEIATEHLHHTPVAEEGQDCICIAATDAPLRFRGLIPRIAQPFIGI
jgi:putative transcriptional regulator